MNSHTRQSLSYQTASHINYSGTQELFDGEEGLARYNSDIATRLYVGLNLSRKNTMQTVVDFGAGSGALAEIWNSKFGIKPICIEIDPQLGKKLKNCGFLTYTKIADVAGKVTSVYTSNVLEHIEDDTKALMEVRSKIESGGKIGIYVPAVPFLFSNLDRNVGHFRRYRRNELIQKVTSAGFEVETCFYNDSLGVLASLAIKFVGYKNSLGLGSKRSLIFYDRFIYPVSKLLDKILFKKIIGKNLFLFAVNKF